LKIFCVIKLSFTEKVFLLSFLLHAALRPEWQWRRI